MKTKTFIKKVSENLLWQIEHMKNTIDFIKEEYHKDSNCIIELAKELIKLTSRNTTLEAQNKSLKSEKEILKIDYEIIQRTCQSLQSALESFEDLKKEADKVTNPVEVWIARDACGAFIYPQEPYWDKQEELYDCKDGNITEISVEIQKALSIELNRRQCKKFHLIEVE